MVAAYIAAGAQAVSALSSLFGGDGPSNKERFNSMVEQSYLTHEHALKSARELPLAQRQGWEKAGIHPIYGMQGGSAAFSPSFTAATGGSGSSVGERISRMGQGISRAAEALIDHRERLQNRLLESQVVGSELDNVKRAADARLATLSAPPGIIDAEGSSSVSALLGNPEIEAASNPAFKQYIINNKGDALYAPNQELAEAIEGMGHIGGSALGAEMYLRSLAHRYKDWKYKRNKRRNESTRDIMRRNANNDWR